jgi:hypothetical protein
MTLSRAMLRVEVADDGVNGFLPGATSLDAINGRGLQLVNALTDRCGVERRPHTVAWFEIDRPLAS